MTEQEHIFLRMTRPEVEAELTRIRQNNAVARKERRLLDVFSGYEQALDDALKGIDRCPTCGKVRRKRKFRGVVGRQA